LCGGDGVLEEQRSALRSGRRECGGTRGGATRQPTGHTTGQPGGCTARERASRSARAGRNDFGSQDPGDGPRDERNADFGRCDTT
jgi:hypothetical protein